MHNLPKLRVGFATIYAWRPHVEHMYFLSMLVKKAGHEAFFLTCDADLPTCYTRELRDRPTMLECLLCRAGSVRSYPVQNVASIGECAPRDSASAQHDWAYSSASTLGRYESETDFASPEFKATATRLLPTVQRSYQAARAWIRDQRLDAVCVFNGRMDVTRAIFEAAKSLGVRVVSVERTGFGDGLQLYPEESCLGLKNVDRLVKQWHNRPLTQQQTVQAASYVARRFLRRNDKEWRAYNVNAKVTDWPVQGGTHKILFIPSSRNEAWGHPDWVSGWPDTVTAYDALITHLKLQPNDLVLRCHPNWAERIGRHSGKHSEHYFSHWAAQRGIHTISSADTTSTLGLIEQCDAIVVTHGSAALEAGLLGKQVIGIAPAAYRAAGLRDAVEHPEQLAQLELLVNLNPVVQALRRQAIARQTLRFIYTMTHRIPQYTRCVRATAPTQFKYDMSVDPKRFIDLLQSGELQADDEAYATDTTGEEAVLQHIEQRDWQGILDALKPVAGHWEPLQRKTLFRPIDSIRSWMPVGDR